MAALSGSLRPHHNNCAGAQVDTPGKALLVGIAVSYVSLVVLIPFVAVFFQVGAGWRSSVGCWGWLGT